MGNKKGSIAYNYLRGLKGFTLIEISVGVFLATLVLLTIYGLFMTSNRIYALQNDVSEMGHNLRMAINQISKDIMVAGLGKPGWTTINNQSGLDFSIRYTGGALDVVGCLGRSEGHLSGNTSIGATTISLNTGEGVRFNTTTKSDIFIGGAENAKIVSVSGDTLTIDTDPTVLGNQGLQYGYNSGTEVSVVKWVTYSVDSQDPSCPVLKLDSHTGEEATVVASYISGMTVTISGNAVEIKLTGKTGNPSRTTGSYVNEEITGKFIMRNFL